MTAASSPLLLLLLRAIDIIDSTFAAAPSIGATTHALTNGPAHCWGSSVPSVSPSIVLHSIPSSD